MYIYYYIYTGYDEIINKTCWCFVLLPYVLRYILGGVLKRKYTPTSIDGEIPGFTDIIVKTYNPGHTHNGVSYDGGGKMGMLLAQMKPGDSIECMGPTGELSYEGEGNFTINRKTGVVKKQVEHLLLVAGGTGITPPLQIMRSTLRDLEMDGVASNTKISLIFANQSPDDIFAADEIERAAAALGSNFRAVHVLEHGDLPQATSDITYAKGTVTKAMLKASLKSAAASTLALVVGPRGMVSEVVGLLDKLGMDKVYKKHTQAVYTLDGAYEDDGW